MNWRDCLRPSALALIAANLIPLAGVIIFRWEIFPLVLLFWCENVIVGIFNALKMIFATPGRTAQWGMKLFLVPFFCVHYGMFTLVHGIFVVVLFGGGLRGGGFPSPQTFISLVKEHQLIWAVGGLFLSHAFSFVYNYFMRGEMHRATLPELMKQPYGRIVVLHLAIIGGGFLMLALKSPLIGLVLLVALKTALDVRGHLRERAKFAPPPDAVGPVSPGVGGL